MLLSSLFFSIFGIFGILAAAMLPICQVLGVIKLAQLGRSAAWWVMLAGTTSTWLSLLAILQGPLLGLHEQRDFLSGQSIFSILTLSGPVLFAAGFAFTAVRAVALQRRTALV